ncbi:MAG: Rieske 2Fe-2S domain-containing protein [Candidatus Marinimicrobia bacterium]|jgi:Rieske Fe-S protein|nr:Rieske 2Fe-2S domain-containing protein [Candidatus Neomarinimicrobiota bacterium]MBT5439800.1 Rieske 2Fe-2S domain-containing protein [Candidatus Neomarinimicrobiota bacterium]
MKRREFIGEACRFAVLCSSPLLLSTLQSCEDVNNESNDDFNNINEDTLEFNLEQSPFDKLKVVGGSVATQGNSFDSNGILLFRQSESIILAFSRRCTHAGATLNAFSNGSSSCSSHGSEFNLSGEPTKGPASLKLDQYIVEIVSNIIKVSKS